ncbi:hypothetical protein HMPREF9094_1152 [Fusobacterium animalis ATCC 51191]|uniref:Uncharacterized protein n=1 Tax=Fusobacterium animalis ATCC 51191 TaxID=997347 RepID=F9EMJ7_9FUSO|nr:hypothetical protein HMPREF9094_1152 [Fusobacterium animalis ATCC 51191]
MCKIFILYIFIDPINKKEKFFKILFSKKSSKFYFTFTVDFLYLQ